MYEYKARITEIIDGDTFEASVDLGFQVYFRERFRLLNYAAPEVTGTEKPLGILAKKKLEELLPIGFEVTMKSKRMEKYGRWLADVTWGDKTLTAYLIELGYGVFVVDGAAQPKFNPSQPYPLPHA